MSEPLAVPAGPSQSAAVPEGARPALLAFFIGVWLALLQFSYFFMLEVHLSSRATSFFIALFFWLVGFLAGLNLRRPRAFYALVGTAPLAYYAAFAALSAWPYRMQILPLVGACIAVGGALAGSFFPHAESRFYKVKLLFFHENNGFILGILAALIGAVFQGRFLLVWSPALAALPVIALLLQRRRPGASPLSPTTTPAAAGARPKNDSPVQ